MEKKRKRKKGERKKRKNKIKKSLFLAATWKLSLERKGREERRGREERKKCSYVL